MAKKRTILIGTSLVTQNTRASKEATTLMQNGYSVTFLGWDRASEAPAVEQLEAGADLELRYLRLKAPLGIKAIFFYPIWWFYVFLSLIATKWDVAHAINLDSIPPAVLAGKLKRKPVIYELLDNYQDVLPLPKLVRNVSIKMDRVFMRLAGAVILADDMQVEGFGNIPNSRVVTVYDSPLDTTHNHNGGHQESDTFALFYGGILSSTKALNLDNLFAAIKGIEGVRVIIAGWGDLVKGIMKWSAEMPDKIEFIGAIDHTQVLERSAGADLLFVLRSSLLPMHKYICGSKLLEAMMCGRPILVNKGTSTARKVSQENCGRVVDATSIEEIRKAIVELKENPELCQELAANARRAYEQQYSWELMEERLMGLYHELTDERD